jgi:flagellar protein FlaJ
MFSVENIGVSGTGAGGGGSTSGIILYTFLLSPMLSMMFIYLAHSMQPKTPVTDMRPYKVFVISGVVGISFFAVMYLFNLFGPIIDLPVALAIALFIGTAPAAVVYNKYQSKRTQTEQGVNSFLRDLTEVRKTGLSPEKCIENLSRREYGTFSRELRKISSEISWGIPVRKVIMDFIKRTKSWMTQIVMFLLVETVDVGGGTIAMIESLARFNNLTQEVEKEKRMAVRPYVIMPYFAALLLVATTTMMLGFTTGTIGLGGTEGQANPAMEGVKAIFNLSCIFHSYMIGIVAGKISEESIGAGFKHASILVIITVVTAKLVPMFVKI